jgi:hypothetical protein
MDKKLFLGIFLSIIISMSFVLVAVPDVGAASVDNSDLLGKSSDELMDIIYGERDLFDVETRDRISAKEKELMHRYLTATYSDDEGLERALRALYTEEIIKRRVIVAAEAAKKQEKPVTNNPETPISGGLPEGPKVNINPGRGLDPFQRMNPSMGGYLGDAYVERSDGTKVIPGKELYLAVDDKVITGKEAKVNIIFSNAGKMNLGPNTVLRVGNALLDQYYLAKGMMKTKISWDYNQKLEIKTPNAKVSVTGTEFIIIYNETTNITAVFLNEGTLDVNSATYGLNLTSGFYCTINPEGFIDVYQLNPEDWGAFGSNFYDETIDQLTPNAYLDIGKSAVKVYAWTTFVVMIISSIMSMLFMNRAKAKSQQKYKSNTDLGRLSIWFGILGIVIVFFPILGYPFSTASTTLARIQKLRTSTTAAKTGYILGCIGVVLNVTACVYLLIMIV